jgi:hypothetical protein
LKAGSLWVEKRFSSRNWSGNGAGLGDAVELQRFKYQMDTYRMIRAYIFGIVFLSALHTYFSILKGNSPISWELLLLFLSPFLFYAWKDVQNIKFGKEGLEFEKSKKVNEYISKAMHGKYLSKQVLDSIFESVAANEWAKLVLARMLMRKGLVAISPSDHGLGDSPSLLKLIELNIKNGCLMQEDASDLERLREITFFAEW